MDYLGYQNYKLNKYVITNTARYNRVNVIEHMSKNTHINNNDNIVYGAAKGGNRDLLHSMIEKNPRNINYLTIAIGGYLDIVMDAIGRSNFNIEDIFMIARYAAKGCNLDIVIEMFEIIHTMSDVSYHIKHSILMDAAKGGCEELIYHLVNDVELSDGTVINFNNWEPYVKNIAYSGAEKLLNHLINRGAFRYETLEDFKDLAYKAARGGQKDILYWLIEDVTLNIGELTEMARNATEGGHKEIVLDMILKDAKFNYLNFGKHEDAKIYFSD